MKSVSLRVALTIAAAATLPACGDDEPTYLSIAALQDPEACKDCHPSHFREWSGSMHAYAADDPVFLAMNRRGQEETGGELGDFCVKCHAPMAVRLGLTTDGLNLAELPQQAKGITCYFCHSVDAVTAEHDNPLVLADDGVMRGGLGAGTDPEPASNAAHRTGYSALLDSSRAPSSSMCGSCHDIVTPSGVALERTYAEWKTTIFADPQRGLSCGGCHMFGTTGVVADDPDANVPLREYGVHEHTFAGIDVALTPWPETEAQLAAIDRDLKGVLAPRLCVVPEEGGRIDYRLDNLGAGHMWPSGAAHDRRAWVEIVAYDAADQVIFSSGQVPDGADPASIEDPNLWEIRDHAYDADGEEAHMFWDIADYDSELLPPAVTTDMLDPRFNHSVTRSYSSLGIDSLAARVEARVHIRPIGYDVLDDLIASGHLDKAVRDQIRTFTLSGTELVWTPDTDDAGNCVVP